MKMPLKFYPKTYGDICEIGKWEKFQMKNVTSYVLPFGELVSTWKTFSREANASFFNLIVKYIWLTQHVVLCGKRNKRIHILGHQPVFSFSKFKKLIIGDPGHIFVGSPSFHGIATYLIDFFPDFLIDSPFNNPEKYQYPYKNISLDHLEFVYQMHNRLELLDEAEKKSMSFGEFQNFAYNWALCYNEDIGKEVYVLNKKLRWVYIQDIKNKDYRVSTEWHNSKFNFDTKHGQK